MVKRGKRKIAKASVRGMLTWSHYRFRSTLLNKAREYPQCTVVVCDEHNTSKTCTRCGWLHPSLGGKPVYTCGQCHLVIGRDANGARNILLRYLALRGLSLAV
jgi:putative transposase